MTTARDLCGLVADPSWAEGHRRRTVTIPDDPEWLAQRLPAHRYCDTHVRGHQSCVDEAARLLAAMKS